MLSNITFLFLMDKLLLFAVLLKFFMLFSFYIFRKFRSLATGEHLLGVIYRPFGKT